MAINLTDFWDKFGEHAAAANTTNIAVETTVKAAIQAASDKYSTEALEIKNAVEGMFTGHSAFASAGGSLNATTFGTPTSNLLVQTVKADNPQLDESVITALRELRRQMIAASATLKSSAPSCTPTYGGTNDGDGVIVISTKRGDGLVNEFIFAENIKGEITSTETGGEAVVSLRGVQTIGNNLATNWPGGSGINLALTSLVATSGGNLVSNGTFETAETNQPNQPADWIVTTGTLGTTLKLTPIEVQTVTISGSPTSGYYTLSWTNADGKTQTTGLIAWNATQTTVQTALQALTGLETVTVSTGGTSPNFVHTVTFTGVTNPAELTSTSNLDVGTISHATTTAASPHVARGARAVEFDSDGAELTNLKIQVTLSAATQYAFSGLFKVDVVPVAGEITVDLVDGVGGAVINDDQGVANSFVINTLTTTLTNRTGVFRTPTNLPEVVYLRIRITTAVSNTTSVFMDEVILAEMTELYTGGLFATMFSGDKNWKINDTLTLPVLNAREGNLHTWAERAYSMRSNRFLLPTDPTGTIPDTL